MAQCETGAGYQAARSTARPECRAACPMGGGRWFTRSRTESGSSMVKRSGMRGNRAWTGSSSARRGGLAEAVCCDGARDLCALLAYRLVRSVSGRTARRFIVWCGVWSCAFMRLCVVVGQPALWPSWSPPVWVHLLPLLDRLDGDWFWRFARFRVGASVGRGCHLCLDTPTLNQALCRTLEW